MTCKQCGLEKAPKFRRGEKVRVRTPWSWLRREPDFKGKPWLQGRILVVSEGRLFSQSRNMLTDTKSYTYLIRVMGRKGKPEKLVIIEEDIKR